MLHLIDDEALAVQVTAIRHISNAYRT